MTTFADDFNRTANPLASPWSANNLGGSTAKLRCSSSAGAAFGQTSAYCSQYVDGVAFTADEEIWAQATTLGVSGPTEIFGLYGRLNGAGASTVTGYNLEIDADGSFKLIRMRNFSTYDALTTFTHAFAAGNWAKLRISGTNPVRLEAFWSSDGVNWTSLGTYDDSAATRLQTGTKVGLEINTSTPRIDNFNAADYVAPSARDDGFFPFI
jgi:hypothetical protein